MGRRLRDRPARGQSEELAPVQPLPDDVWRHKRGDGVLRRQHGVVEGCAGVGALLRPEWNLPRGFDSVCVKRPFGAFSLLVNQEF